MFGEMVLSLLALRFRRCAWMLLPLVEMIALLSGDAQVAERSRDALKSAHEDFILLQNKPWSTVRIRQVLSRHPCSLLSVQQILIGMSKCGWDYRHERIQTVLHNRFSCVVGTQIVEDCNNLQKHARQFIGWGGRFRRPESSMHIAIQPKLVETTHRYRAPKQPPAPPCSAPLGHDAFHASASSCSIPADSICGTKAEAAYFSPTAENVGIALGDLPVIKEALRVDDPDVFAQTWQGFWCSASHAVCFQVRDREDGRVTTDWHVALCHFPDSACVAAPVTLEMVPGSENDTFVRFLPALPTVICTPMCTVCSASSSVGGVGHGRRRGSQPQVASCDPEFERSRPAV